MMPDVIKSRFEILRENGFSEPPICDLMSVFHGPCLALETGMSVRGDHCDECAYVYYASMEVNGELLDGLFYVPSLLEYLYFLGRKSGWSFDLQLQHLNAAISADTRLVFLSGFPAIFSEIYSTSWSERDLRFEISDMLKIVGALDYLLSEELNRMPKE